MNDGLPRAAHVVEKRDVGGGLLLVSIAVDEICRASYRVPGQYAELTIDGKNGFFALGSETLVAPWEIVVRDNGGASNALVHAEIGANVMITPALGRGFELQRADGKPVAIAVAGSAVSVARSLVAWRAAHGHLAATYIFVGGRSVADAPFLSELETWADRGARVWLCASRDATGVARGVTVVSGYVQDAIIAAVARGEVPEDTVAFVAGHDAMIGVLRGPNGASGPALSSVYTNV